MAERPPARKPAPEEQPVDWLDRLLRFQLVFGRFLRDFLGVFLLALALMSLLALLGLTRGALLTPWASLLRNSFGLGAYLVVLATAAAGVLALRRDLVELPWGRVIALELTAFLTLALLSYLGGQSLERAHAGLDGGRLGWGLSALLTMLFGPTLGLILLSIGWLLSLLSALGVWTWLEHSLARYAGLPVPDRLPPPAPPVESPRSAERRRSAPPEERAERQPESRPEGVRSRPAEKLPPAYRKSLPMPEKSEKRPVKAPPRGERLPPLNLLVSEQSSRPDERTINQTAGLIEKTLAEFGIPAQVVGFRVGPTVTQFAVQPGFIEKSSGAEEDAQRMKVRVAQIASLQKDLALALSAERLRIEAPVPGRSYVGIEVPNSRTTVVRLRPLLESEAFVKSGAPLTIALGRDVAGQPVVADLARMPHLLIAGATGSGKSVCITALAACLAMNNAPEDLRLVMIDSKMVELLRFNGLPHLYGKVETDIQRILGVLRWLVVEMEHRYLLLERAHARDLEAYNRKQQKHREGAPAQPALPRIVVLIDELADLMMSAPDQTEHNLVRLAQMARATGIHLVVATQRPSTDVVTGLIKANFPARLAFAVASGVDSRVILDTTGAETLLGRGDMLFLNPEVGNPIRAQGVYVTDAEIEKLIAYWNKMAPASDEPAPWEALLSEPEEGDNDTLVAQAAVIVRETQRASASLLQRRLRIGYPRAARLLDQLAELGIVGPSPGGGREREVLVGPQDALPGENGNGAGEED